MRLSKYLIMKNQLQPKGYLMQIACYTICGTQISVTINGTLVSTSNNLLNYASYIRFMLTTPISYKKLSSLAIGYEYKTDTDPRKMHRDVTTQDLHL